MKHTPDNPLRKELARLSRIRWILVGIGAVLCAALVVSFLLWDPLSPPESAPVVTPQRVETLPPETLPPETLPEITETTAATEAPEAPETTEAPPEKIQEAPPVEPDAIPGDLEENQPQVELTDTVSLTPQIEKPEPQPGHPADLTPDAHPETEKTTPWKWVFLTVCLLLGADIAAVIALSIAISRRKQVASRDAAPAFVPDTPAPAPKPEAPTGIRVAGIHNIGARPYQEDSLGTSLLYDGILAVVADGMGGLSGGDRVSQKIVYTMLEYGKQLPPGRMDGALEAMIDGTTQEVNRMLGPDGLYKSGSTALAVLVRKGRFHWITVGDSRIYFYRNGKLTQLNQEHNVGQDALLKAVRGELTFPEAKATPKKGRVTSFIGMGKLRYVEKSCRSIPLAPGDRIVLMTDGVFNMLPEETILSILENDPDVQAAAEKMEQLVLQVGHPRQDNFTAILLGF